MTTLNKNIKVKVREVERLWFTRGEAAKYLGVSQSYIKKLNLVGELPYAKFGGLVFVRKSDIDKKIEGGMIWK